MAAEEKKNIRKQILAVREKMPPAVRREKSNSIAEALWAMPLYQEADVILIYVNYKSEVNTTDLVNKALADGKLVFAPKVSGETMEFYRLTGINDLQEGYCGIPEPVPGEAFDMEMDTGHTLMLMPGAVFDEHCHRIGYGKGFYDRYLMRLSESGTVIHTLALCFECQVLSEIPSEVHDIRPQMVLTEKRLIQGPEWQTVQTGNRSGLSGRERKWERQ